MRVMPDRRFSLSWLARPFTALLLFGAVGMVAMVVTFSVVRGVAARPLPAGVTPAPAAAANSAAAAPTVAAAAPTDPGPPPPALYPAHGGGNGYAPGGGNSSGGDGGD